MNEGYRIKERRKELGLSAEKLAEKTGLSAATIYRYENGDIKKVPAPSIEIIANALNTTASYLLGEPALYGEPAMKVALFGGDVEVTDAMWEEAKAYAQVIAARERGRSGEK